MPGASSDMGGKYDDVGLPGLSLSGVSVQGVELMLEGEPANEDVAEFGERARLRGNVANRRQVGGE